MKLYREYSDKLEDNSDEIHPDLSIEDRLGFMQTKTRMEMEFGDFISIEFLDDEWIIFMKAVRDYLELEVETGMWETGTWGAILIDAILETVYKEMDQ